MNYIDSFLLQMEKERKRPLRVGFIGLGVSNLALLDLIYDGRREITLRCDDSAEIPPSALQKIKGLRRGRRALENINEDLLILSPSVRREREELRDAAARGVILTSDAELFFSEYRGEAIGVSGSDGKSTTVTLAKMIIEASGGDASAVGNIGVPFCSHAGGVAVTELSSFMLRYFSPRLSAALITCISPNHLNWHDSYGEYIESKVSIWKQAERIILSADDAVTAERIGDRRPYAAYSVRLSYKELWEKHRPEITYTFEDGYIQKNGRKFISLSRLGRRETYNVQNLMGAMALSEGYATEEGARLAAESFHGLPHRAEPIGFKRGAYYIDSSIDTTPERTATTLAALDKPVLLLLGGRGKGLSLEPLIPAVAKYALRIGAYGEEGKRIYEELKLHPETEMIPTEVFSGFDGALAYLIGSAAEGDTVLLSPAATAYGEFKSYIERGIRFREAVSQMQ